MTGTTTGSAQRLRQIIGIAPDWRPVAAAGVAARHGIAVAVDVGALPGSRVVVRRQVAGSCQNTPVEVGDTVHMGRVVEIDNSMAVNANQTGVQSFAGGDMGCVGAGFGIGVGGNLGRVRCVVIRGAGRYRCRTAMALAALIRG